MRKNGNHQTRRNGRKMKKRGGSMAATLRKPFVSSPAAGPVGYPWDGGKLISWPGVVGNGAGITMSNNYGYNTKVVDPPVSSSNRQCGPCAEYVGGKRKGRKTKRRGRGRKASRKSRRVSSRRHHTKHLKGGFTGGDMVNIWRNGLFDLKKAIAGWEGVKLPASANPNATAQPIDKKRQVVVPRLPKIEKMYQDAANKVAKI